MRNIAIFLLFLKIIEPVNAQTPVYSNEYLSLGVGARAFSLANSCITSVDNPSAIYWNPASLVTINKKIGVEIMHAEYFAGIAKYDFAGFTYKTNDTSSIGLGLIRFGIDDIPNTLELIHENGNVDYSRIKKFSVADYAFLFSYAKKSRIKGLNYGGTVKIIYRKEGDFADAYGFGFDAGIRYSFKSWKFGIVGRDVTSTFNAWIFNNQYKDLFLSTGNEAPKNSIEITLPKLITGVARDFDLGKKFNLMTEFDTDFTFNGKRNILIKSDFLNIDPHAGLEFDYNKIVFLRMGAGNFQKIPGFGAKSTMTFQPNMGIGFRFKGICLDYALTDIGDQSAALYSNVFSLIFLLNARK